MFPSVLDRIDDEVTRRLVHASTSVAPLSYVFIAEMTWWHVQVFLSLALVGAFGLEIVRLYVGLEWWIFDRLTREYEQENLAAYFLGGVGLTLVAFLFPPAGADPVIASPFDPSPVAVPAMLMLTIGDPFSGLLGAGELRAVKQTWVLLATFGLTTLIASAFVPPVAAILGGLAATAADGAKPVIRGYVVDDNLTIAPSAAVAMFLAIEYLPALGL
ncbi:Dolichol kinase [Halorhabdus sp. SVX81]|uniref:dolichol kinase n=1 Tax=Halorhabdus sp. SVX81 TaxID=2978283 RepID=UPI0023DB78A1|nr:dolichol kinase [Halorhabdus sp. SVX81]WEL16323.1 Dolichol kinase [Halorhabdus sp. SVX81]